MDLSKLAYELIKLTDKEKLELDDLISNYNKTKIIYFEKVITGTEIFNIKVFDDFYSLYQEISVYQSWSYKQSNTYEKQKSAFNSYGIGQYNTTKATYGYAYKIGTENYKFYWTDVKWAVDEIKQTKEYISLLRQKKLERIIK